MPLNFSAILMWISCLWLAVGTEESSIPLSSRIMLNFGENFTVCKNYNQRQFSDLIRILSVSFCIYQNSLNKRLGFTLTFASINICNMMNKSI